MGKRRTYDGQKIMNYKKRCPSGWASFFNDRGGDRTHGNPSEVDSQGVLSTAYVVITFPTPSSRTVHAPFNAHGSPDIQPYITDWFSLVDIPCVPSPCIRHYPDHLSTTNAPSP